MPIGSNGVSSGSGRRRCGGASGERIGRDVIGRRALARDAGRGARHGEPGRRVRIGVRRSVARGWRRDRLRLRLSFLGAFLAGLVFSFVLCLALAFGLALAGGVEAGGAGAGRRLEGGGRLRLGARVLGAARALEARRVLRIAVELGTQQRGTALGQRRPRPSRRGTPNSAPTRSARARGERRRRGTPLPPVPTVRASRLMSAPRVPRNVFRIRPFHRYPQRPAARPNGRSEAPERFG